MTSGERTGAGGKRVGERTNVAQPRIIRNRTHTEPDRHFFLKDETMANQGVMRLQWKTDTGY